MLRRSHESAGVYRDNRDADSHGCPTTCWDRATGLGCVEASIRGPPCAWGCPGSAQPGPRNPVRETIARIPAAALPRRCRLLRHLSRAPLKSPEIPGKTRGCPCTIPECEHRGVLGGGAGSPERTRLATGSRPHADGRTYVECGMDPGKSRHIPDQVFDRRQAGWKVTARQSRASHLIPAMSRNIPDRNFDRGYRGPRGPRAEWCRWRLPRRLWRARHQPACAEHASVSRAVGAAVVTPSGPWLGPCGASWDARSASCSAAFSPLIFLPCYPFHLTTRR